jgi:hypothetical protein
MLSLILQVIACLLLFSAAFKFQMVPRVDVGWLGLALWVLAGLLLHA